MRKTFGFHGGVHLPENKRQSLRTPIAAAGIPPELVLPLSQHTGTPALPLVTAGARVLKGQMIAAAQGSVSVPLHAPTSGTIAAIEDRLIAHPSGHRAPCIVIRTDGQDEGLALHGTPDYAALDAAAVLNLIRNAGIAGMGGVGFPSAVKLSVAADTRINTLIINGAECEPYVTADDILMRERAADVIEGTRILRHLLAPDDTLIGVEDNKPQAIAALRAAAQGSGIEIVALPTVYPSGGEKQLIETLTGRQVPSGRLPSAVGVICQNIASTVAIFEAVVQGRPLISRITTVTGASIREPQNFQVLIGTPARFLLEQAGYEAKNNHRLIMGGPMMGVTVPDTTVPIVKTTSCLLAPTDTDLPTPPPPQACIRCGMCAEACPVSLLPQQLFWFAQGREFDKLEQHKLFDCIECGACSYVCPSYIPLVQYYRAAKAEVMQLRQEHAIADAARIRFESHQQRLARTAAEKAAKRAARKQAAGQRAQSMPTEGADDPIQAAIARSRAKKAALQTGQNNELEQLERAVVTTHQRLATARAKLAQTQDSDLAAALQSGIDKTRERLAAAEQALCDYQQTRQPTAAVQQPVDAAQAALAKAVAARAREAALSPAQRARADLEKLQQRLQKAQDSLARSRENGEEEKVLEALESTVARLSVKISAAQQQLHAAADD